MGKLGEQVVGRALSTFIREAPGIVKDHDGVTVYAGGDDVLTMLPSPRALSCAASLSRCYQSAFGDMDGEATLSAAVVFANVRLPLSTVIAEAHRLLDEVAKEDNGRDSLAAGVLKRGGLNCQWATTWTRTHPGGDSSPSLKLLGDLAKHLNPSAVEPGLSSALIYRIRETLTLLCGWDRWQPGAWGVLPADLDIRAFLRAEIFRSLAVRIDEGAETRADELADLVWSVLGPSRATTADGNAEIAEAGVDALLLARFLADPEREEDVR